MDAAPRLLDFEKVVAAAFPIGRGRCAQQAAQVLLPFVDNSYRKATIKMTASGGSINVPSRVHYEGLHLGSLNVTGEAWIAANCLCTRSTDGHLRHAALRNIVRSQSPDVIPFVVLLAGEYVVEIIDDMVAALPTIDRPSYANFVRENRSMMKRLRSKATSYWNEYYRASYASAVTYPGLLFLHQIEQWAS